MKRAKGGCAASFATLLERHYDSIHRMAWRWSGSETEAEDVAQDVCVKLATAIQGYRADAHFRTWLYRITYHAVIDRIRTRRRLSPMRDDKLMALIDGPANDTPETAVLSGELWDAVRALPAQQRDAVLLVYAEDLSHREAAEVMGCSEKTVSWHLHEARKRLKVTLEAVG